MSGAGDLPLRVVRSPGRTDGSGPAADQGQPDGTDARARPLGTADGAPPPGPTTSDPEAVAPHEPAPEGPPCLYFDVSEPECYLVCERALRALPVATPWVPIDAAALDGASRWEGLRCAEEGDALRADLERRAAAQGLQPVRWPPTVPFDGTRAQLVATYAKQIGRVVSFTLPAFRQAYAGGHDLSREAFVLIAASACEMHPRAVVQAMERASVRDALADATARARERGVRTVPAVWTGDAVLEGPDCLERAAALLGAGASD